MIKLSDEALQKLLKPYALTLADITYLGGGREDGDGIVYAYQRGGLPMAIKLMAWVEPEESAALTVSKYEERVRFANYLGSNGAAIVGPEPTEDGKIYHSCRDGKYTYITYIMRRADGSNLPPEKWDNEYYRLWGQAVGRMHRLTLGYPHWQRSATLDEQGNPALGWQKEVGFFRQWCKDEQVSHAWEGMQSRLESLPVERRSFGFIHNDPHSANILYDGKSLHIIDFDVANYHWFATDIAIALQSILFMKSGGMERPMEDREAVRRFLNEFMAGYETEHRLDKYWLDRLDLFVQYRRLLLFTVMQDWLSTDAAAKETWKRVIADEPQYIAEILNS